MNSIRKCDPGAKVVVIDPDPDPHFIERCDGPRVCIIRRDATGKKALQAARVARAGEIIAVTLADETNIRVAAEVREVRKAAKLAPAFCRVHIANSYLPEAIQKSTDATADAHTTLRFFDVFDNEARRVLLSLSAEGHPHSTQGKNFAPLDGAGIGSGHERSVHVVVLGMGRMGSALAARAAKMGHVANGKLLRISVIDRNADRQRDQFLFRYAVLSEQNQICELNWESMYAESGRTRDLIVQFAAEPNTLLHVFVCLDSDARAAEIGLRLWEIIAGFPGTYMNIRIKSEASLAPILESSVARIRTFGMLEDTCNEETFRGERNEAVARAIHEAFVAARKASNPARKNDSALADWERLGDDFRESNRQQADHMAIKMRAIGCQIVETSAPGEPVNEFAPAEVELLAELEHKRWNAERRLGGWRHGNETDKPRRIHKYLVPWKDLPGNVQEYDREAVRNIPAWLAQVMPSMKLVRGAEARDPVPCHAQAT